MKLRQVNNPPNPYVSRHAEWLEPPPDAKIEVYEESSGSILSRNDSPDLPFTWSVNPYRGCQHACAYCYARPYHEYLGLGAGTDFETKLVVKKDAPELLRRAFAARTWKYELVNFSGITDCYQPIEAAFGITRECLKVCAEVGNPVVIVTKSFLVTRDIDILTELTERGLASVRLSIPFFDARPAALLEPQAPPPARRLEAVRRLSEAGIEVGVFVAPIIPGLSDTEIPSILEAAADAGAKTASFVALRLPGSVESVFIERLRTVMPLRAERVLNKLRAMRGGKLSHSAFGKRMRGDGAYWESICDLFDICRRRFGLKESLAPPRANRPPQSNETPDRESHTKKKTTNPAQMRFDFGG